MVSTQINIAVVSHVSRRDICKKLYMELCLDDVHCDVKNIRIFVDTKSQGALRIHKQALKWAEATGVPTVIIEDDAVPVLGFCRLVSQHIADNPDMAQSFYLGTGRPVQYQETIADAVSKQRRFLRLPTLIHGVCYYVPHRFIAGKIGCIDDSLPADYAVGAMVNNDFIYPVRSLVDHLDGESVEVHPDGEIRSEPRKAWLLADKTIREAETLKAEGLK